MLARPVYRLLSIRFAQLFPPRARPALPSLTVLPVVRVVRRLPLVFRPSFDKDPIKL